LVGRKENCPTGYVTVVDSDDQRGRCGGRLNGTIGLKRHVIDRRNACVNAFSQILLGEIFEHFQDMGKIIQNASFLPFLLKIIT
jgi:hypothetical protein